MMGKRKKATELDHLLHEELNKFEAQSNLSAGIISQEELTEALLVIKNSVEEVFGTITSRDPLSGGEVVRSTAYGILLEVIRHVCPRQTQSLYNIIEHQDPPEG